MCLRTRYIGFDVLEMGEVCNAAHNCTLHMYFYRVCILLPDCYV